MDATVIIVLLGIVVLVAGFFIGHSYGVKEGIETGLNIAYYVRYTLFEGGEGSADDGDMGD